MSSACPVPSATTRTLMPVSFSNSGRMWPNRPDCSVDVVDDTTMNLSWAPVAGVPSTRSAPTIPASS
jgi:hypothetical protein